MLASTQSSSPSNHILFDPDYIRLAKFGHSLEKLMERYPDGVPDRVAASALDISIDEYRNHQQNLVVRLRHLLGVVV